MTRMAAAIPPMRGIGIEQHSFFCFPTALAEDLVTVQDLIISHVQNIPDMPVSR